MKPCGVYFSVEPHGGSFLRWKERKEIERKSISLKVRRTKRKRWLLGGLPLENWGDVEVLAYDDSLESQWWHYRIKRERERGRGNWVRSRHAPEAERWGRDYGIPYQTELIKECKLVVQWLLWSLSSLSIQSMVAGTKNVQNPLRLDEVTEKSSYRSAGLTLNDLLCFGNEMSTTTASNNTIPKVKLMARQTTLWRNSRI